MDESLLRLTKESYYSLNAAKVWEVERMELIVVAVAILVILLAAKNGSSKRSSKPSKDDYLDEDTIYG